MVIGRADIFVPRDSQSPPQEFLLTSAPPRSIEIFEEAILNLKGQIDSLLPEGPVIICFIIPLYSEGTQGKKIIILIESLLDLPWLNLLIFLV